MTRAPLFASALLASILFFCGKATISAQTNAVWSGAALDGNWNNSANWVPMTVPQNYGDTATFDVSAVTNVSISSPDQFTFYDQIDSATFNLDAPSYTITVNAAAELDFAENGGAGVVNNSTQTQNFVIAGGSGTFGGVITFYGTSSAGSNTSYTTNGGADFGGEIDFDDSSTAGSATITNAPDVNGGNNGRTSFNNTSSAAHSNITNQGTSVDGGDGAQTTFNNNSTAGSATIKNNPSSVAITGNPFFAVGSTSFEGASAGNATITNVGATVAGAAGGETYFSNATAATATINNTGSGNDTTAALTTFAGSSTAASATINNSYGDTVFNDTATAGNATITNNAGGDTAFYANSTGGTARIIMNDGQLNIDQHNAPGVTIGSVEGAGNVFLGANNLTVGSNNLSTTFSGTIQDGSSAAGGSLTKTGSGTFTLSSANTYTGGTTISGGTLIAAHDGALGSGNVSLLSGSGITLTLQNGATSNYVAVGASISFNSNNTINLSYTGVPDQIGALILNGVNQQPGTYGAAGSGAEFILPEFTGTGELLVVPEPSVPLILLSGIGTLLCFHARRRQPKCD